jgi:hypothetical protein
MGQDALCSRRLCLCGRSDIAPTLTGLQIPYVQPVALFSPTAPHCAPYESNLRACRWRHPSSIGKSCI